MPSTSLKIGITCYPTAGGSGVVATELGIRLAGRGHDVHFICEQVPLRLREFHPRISFHPVEAANYPVFRHQPYSLNLAAKMSEVAENHSLDLLHVHYAIPHATSAVLARQIVHPRPLRILTTLHGTDITLVGQQPSFFRVTRFSIEQSDAVTVVSDWLAARTRETFGIQKPLTVVHNFVDPERFKPLVRATDRARFAAADELLIVHISNFRPVKNTPRVVEVFHRLRRVLPVRLLMIGEGPELPLCEQLTADYGLRRSVTYLGSQEYVEALLPLADLLLLPSEHESFGLVVLEALSCGVPVVATDRGGTTEIIRDGETGFLVDPDDPVAIAARAEEILTDPERRRRMGVAGRQDVLDRFQSAAMVRRYEEVYDELMAGSG